MIKRSKAKRVAAGAVLGVAIAVLAIGSAAAASLTEADLTVQPPRLPRQGGAPVTITVDGTIAQDQLEEVKSLTLHLDRQLTVQGADQPTCIRADVNGKSPSQARRKCQAALVGSGRLVQRFQFLESPPEDLTLPVLLFNSAAGHVLVYTFVPGPTLGPAAYVSSGSASGHTLEIPFAKGVGGLTTSFAFRIGRTWSASGRKLGYLTGRCASGTLHSKITVALARRSETVPQQQPC